MYQDPARWGLTLQTYVQLTMLVNHLSSTVGHFAGLSARSPSFVGVLLNLWVLVYVMFSVYRQLQ